MKNITIIGAGLSGTLVVINLLKQVSAGHKFGITLIDRRPEDEMGSAYSSDDACLLLNVPACRMGAFSNDPAHFLSWAQIKNPETEEWGFLPRKLYRNYIQELFQKALRENKNAVFKRISRAATDINVSNKQAEINVNGESILSDKVVLALGNFPPRNLPMRNNSFYESNHYFQNPWQDQIFSSLPSNETVFLIGTGQTTVDAVIRLHARKHAGRIIALSRHGLLPLPHTRFETYPSFYSEIIKLKTLSDIFRIVRRHFSEALKVGTDENAVIDSMRSYTQELWMNLPAPEKNRFLRHLFRYFEIIRSRIPPENMEIVNRLLTSGQLSVLKGRICDMVPDNRGVEVCYLQDGKTKEQTETAALVVNCIGPELDYTRMEDPLIKNLLRKRIIRPHATQLGINAFPNGAVMDVEGKASNVFYTLGSTMRGVLWETIAAPEIRWQAEQLAQLLLRI